MTTPNGGSATTDVGELRADAGALTTGVDGGKANGHELSLSGLSSDQMTIFYRDANAEQTLALSRQRVDLPYMDPISTKTASDAVVHDAHPAEDCKASFYRSVGGELLVADAR